MIAYTSDGDENGKLPGQHGHIEKTKEAYCGGGFIMNPYVLFNNWNGKIELRTYPYVCFAFKGAGLQGRIIAHINYFDVEKNKYKNKEINLIDSMNEELIDDVLGQFVDIYKVDVESTNANVYGESSTKYYNVGTTISERQKGTTRAFNIINIFRVFVSIAKLTYNVTNRENKSSTY